ncbi:MAG TPA: SGNH/GDSL hydrolase family protein [Thermoanaerobaculia bacterium]
MALAVVAGEVGLRVVGWSKPHLYRPDPQRGWALAPGARGLYTDEGRGWVEVNRFGFRGPAPRVGKPEGTFRIVVLGDSQTEALQVDFEDTFGEVLERRLAACAELPGGARSVEVLNFGVSGYGTAQALLTLRHAAAAFDPDLVLLAVYTGNDVRNNVEAIERDPLRPYFTLGDDGRLALDGSFRDEPGFRRRASWLGRAAYGVLDGSRLAQVAKAVWAAARDRRAAAEAEARAGGPAAAEVGLDNDVYREPSDPAWQQAWAVTEALILALDREAAAAGADFALATLSNGIQVHPDAATRRSFAARLGVPDLTYPDRRLAAFARRHGIPALPLVFPLARLAEERGLYLHGFAEPPPDAAGDLSRWNQGHWNPRGHHAAGTLLADWLCRQALPPNRRPTAPTPPAPP